MTGAGSFRPRSFCHCERGATAAEFALVFPVAILVFLAIIDSGRYLWRINQIEKAVQMGTRYAVATSIIPAGLNSADYAGVVCNGRALTAGDTICREALGQVICNKAASALQCTCNTATGGCPALGTPDGNAWSRIVRRIRYFARGVPESAITVRYSGSGIGYVGDPATTTAGGALSDVSPIVSVEVSGVPFRSFSLLGKSMRLPRVAYSLTLEDGDGSVAN